MVTLQVIVAPWQAPLQLVNVAFVPGTAVNWTMVPPGNDVPGIDWVTPPGPAAEIVSVNEGGGGGTGSPVPVSVTICGESEALSATDTVALRPPVA